jgi:hypothetical protein
VVKKAEVSLFVWKIFYFMGAGGKRPEKGLLPCLPAYKTAAGSIKKEFFLSGGKEIHLSLGKKKQLFCQGGQTLRFDFIALKHRIFFNKTLLSVKLGQGQGFAFP